MDPDLEPEPEPEPESESKLSLSWYRNPSQKIPSIWKVKDDLPLPYTLLPFSSVYYVCVAIRVSFLNTIRVINKTFPFANKDKGRALYQ